MSLRAWFALGLPSTFSSQFWIFYFPNFEVHSSAYFFPEAFLGERRLPCRRRRSGRGARLTHCRARAEEGHREAEHRRVHQVRRGGVRAREAREQCAACYATNNFSLRTIAQIVHMPGTAHIGPHDRFRLYGAAPLLCT